MRDNILRDGLLYATIVYIAANNLTARNVNTSLSANNIGVIAKSNILIIVY